MRRLIIVFAALVASATGVAQAAAPPVDTAYVAGLRRTAALVTAGGQGLDGLAAGDARLPAAAAAMQSAAAEACRTLRGYQSPTTRFGTAEESALIGQIGTTLDAARSRLRTLAGSGLPTPTAAQRSTALRVLRAYADDAVRVRVASWVRDEGLADALVSADLDRVRAELRRAVRRRIDTQVSTLSRRAAGVSLSLRVPLARQVRAVTDDAVLRLLARTALRWDPTGLAIEFIGRPVARFVRARLREALRDHRHVTERTNRTLAGFTARQAELQRLIDAAATTPLRSVRGPLSRAQRALDAVTYLRSDLAKQRRADLQARLAAGEAALRAKVTETRASYLLDSPLARSDRHALADSACAAHADITRLVAKFPKAEGILGDWPAGGGVMRITATGAASFEGRMIKPYTFCRSGSVPTGQVEAKFTRTGPNTYSGTIRYYRLSDCRFIGEATGATWEYQPATDTLRACSYSPDPNYAGGGCSTEKRVPPA